MTTIKFAAVSRNYFNMPIWVAQHCNLFKDEGIDVDTYNDVELLGVAFILKRYKPLFDKISFN